LTPGERAGEIRRRLELEFAPLTLEVEDESYKHAGHEGARDGRGHFRVLIISGSFAGKTALQRHRAVYRALGDLMQSDIHALNIEAYSADEL
jgi:BolA protein